VRDRPQRVIVEGRALMRYDSCRETVMNRSQRPIVRSSPSLFREIEREKQASRDVDDRDLASGRKSSEQLCRENELFHGCRVRIDYKSCKHPR
jgi:hypothetical protein